MEISLRKNATKFFVAPPNHAQDVQGFVSDALLLEFLDDRVENVPGAGGTAQQEGFFCGASVVSFRFFAKM